MLCIEGKRRGWQTHWKHMFFSVSDPRVESLHVFTTASICCAATLQCLRRVSAQKSPQARWEFMAHGSDVLDVAQLHGHPFPVDCWFVPQAQGFHKGHFGNGVQDAHSVPRDSERCSFWRLKGLQRVFQNRHETCFRYGEKLFGHLMLLGMDFTFYAPDIFHAFSSAFDAHKGTHYLARLHDTGSAGWKTKCLKIRGGMTGGCCRLKKQRKTSPGVILHHLLELAPAAWHTAYVSINNLRQRDIRWVYWWSKWTNSEAGNVNVCMYNAFNVHLLIKSWQPHACVNSQNYHRPHGTAGFMTFITYKLGCDRRYIPMVSMIKSFSCSSKSFAHFPMTHRFSDWLSFFRQSSYAFGVFCTASSPFTNLFFCPKTAPCPEAAAQATGADEAADCIFIRTDKLKSFPRWSRRGN